VRSHKRTLTFSPILYISSQIVRRCAYSMSRRWRSSLTLSTGMPRDTPFFPIRGKKKKCCSKISRIHHMPKRFGNYNAVLTSYKTKLGSNRVFRKVAQSTLKCAPVIRVYAAPSRRRGGGGGRSKDAAGKAAKYGLFHVWIDTCCIGKSSSTELSESINSMFA
jgi:hypothetical protein